jgi:phasin family protein
MSKEKLNELNHKAAEAALQLTQVSIEQGERLMKLQLEAVRGMLDDSFKAAKSLTEVRDPQQWVSVQERNLRDMMARLTDFSRSLHDIAGRTQKEVGSVLESRMAEVNAQFQDMVDEMARSAPPGSEPAFVAIKQTLTMANSLAETMARTARQFAESAESAIKAASEAATKGGKSV